MADVPRDELLILLEELRRPLVLLPLDLRTLEDPAALISTARAAAILCRALAQQLTAETCPGPHEPRQHRDGRPAWCPACQRTAEGVPLSDVTSALGRSRDRAAGPGADHPDAAGHPPGSARRGPES